MKFEHCGGIAFFSNAILFKNSVNVDSDLSGPMKRYKILNMQGTILTGHSRGLKCHLHKIFIENHFL
jgi:hypothetical protein